MIIEVKMIEKEVAQGGERNINNPKERVEEAIKRRDAETLKKMIRDGIMSTGDIEKAIENEKQKYHINFDDFRFSIDVLDTEIESLNRLKEEIRKYKKSKEWKEICEEIETGVWEYETSDEEEIRDYFELDGDVLEWMDKYTDKEFFLTIHVSPEKGIAERAIGIWNDDVGYGYDNRIYENDDYGAVIEWLNKIAQEEE